MLTDRRNGGAFVRNSAAWLGLYSSLHSFAAHSCRDFPVPAGYYLRTGAEYLNCDGPCDPTLHLETLEIISSLYCLGSSLFSHVLAGVCLKGFPLHLFSLSIQPCQISFFAEFDHQFQFFESRWCTVTRDFYQRISMLF